MSHSPAAATVAAWVEKTEARDTAEAAVAERRPPIRRRRAIGDQDCAMENGRMSEEEERGKMDFERLWMFVTRDWLSQPSRTSPTLRLTGVLHRWIKDLHVEIYRKLD